MEHIQTSSRVVIQQRWYQEQMCNSSSNLMVTLRTNGRVVGGSMYVDKPDCYWKNVLWINEAKANMLMCYV